MSDNEMKSLNKKKINSPLALAVQKAAQKLVNCSGCTKCCEKGIAYVLPEEKEHLESMGVPLIQIDEIYFIKRKSDGSCSMLDKQNKQCSIYENRPVCCRAFPLDVFSRRGSLEWGMYTYCPTDRLIPINLREGKAELDLEVVSYLTSFIEKHLPEKVLRFLDLEDRLVAQIEILDEHKNDFVILGPVIKR